MPERFQKPFDKLRMLSAGRRPTPNKIWVLPE